jgi:catechol 2,3-dioxygenase-like lactoylglutathione lyase family enzyme
MSMIARLDHVSLSMPVGEEAAARAFFAGVLGLPEIPKPDDGNRMDGCWFDLGGGQQLHLLAETVHAPATRAHPAFCVNDLMAAREALDAAGAPIHAFMPSDGRERFFSADPFGNRLEFMESRRG